MASSQMLLFGSEIEESVFQSELHVRDLQSAWVDRTIQLSNTGNSAILVAATGVGKTAYAAQLALEMKAGKFNHFCNYKKPCMLFLAHTKDLVNQAAESLTKLLPGMRIEVEQGERRSDPDADIVVGCTKSMAQERRLRAMGEYRFTIGLVDEGHHYLLRNIEWSFIRRWFKTFWVGVTATPDQSDGTSLRQSFSQVIDHYPMYRAIQDGWLVKVHHKYEYLKEIDLDPSTIKPGGDFTDEEIAEQMEKEMPLMFVAKTAIKYATMRTKWRDSRQAMVFCAGTRHAEKIAELINRKHRSSSWVGEAVFVHCHMDDKDREDALESYKRGEKRYLCVMNVGLEGFDHDGTGLAVNSRLSVSRRMVEQMVGRIVRPLRVIRRALSEADTAEQRCKIIAASDKPGGLFVDITGTNHKLVLRTKSLIDVLAGKSVVEWTPYDDDMIGTSIKRKKVEALDTSISPDLMEEIEKLRQLAIEEDKRLKKEKEQKIIALWGGVRYTVKTASEDIDPFDLYDIRMFPPMILPSPRLSSPGMLKALVNQGIDRKLASQMTKSQAKSMLNVLAARRKAGLCTPRQAAVLQAHGEPYINVTFADASRIIDSIFKGTRP